MPWEKQFDRQQTLDRAVDAFWEAGYPGLSMAGLLERMGVGRGSFYDTYGSKRDLLIEALNRYCHGRGSDFARLTASKPVRSAVRDFFEWVAESSMATMSEQSRRGCLAVNTAIELGPSDLEVAELVEAAFEAHQNAFAELIRRGQESGELSESLDAEEVAAALLALTLGMRVLARTGCESLVRESVAQAVRLLN